MLSDRHNTSSIYLIHKYNWPFAYDHWKREKKNPLTNEPSKWGQGQTINLPDRHKPL